MTYGLTRLGTGSEGVVAIPESQYKSIVHARDQLLVLLFLEQKFDLVIENFLELETELLSSSARYLMHGETDFHWFQNEKALLNRRLFNLLSAGRAYIDYARPSGGQLLGADSPEAALFDQQFSHYYDNEFGYRVMEAMRNHVLHRGFPIHVLEYSADLMEQQARTRFRYRVAIHTKTSYLAGHFKAAVLAELNALGGRVDVKPLARDYVHSLAIIHEHLRSALQRKITAWEAQFTSAIDQFRAAFPKAPSLKGLVAAQIDGANVFNEVAIVPEFLEQRRELEAKNGRFANLRKRYVSGEVKDEG
jgi:hypothetical protein